MDSDQIRLIRTSWAVVSHDPDSLSTTLYALLFERQPAARELFAHVDMDEQRRKFVATIRLIIAVLDDPARIVSEVIPSGRRHGGYGVTAADYEAAGGALLDALASQLGDAFTPNTRDAWKNLYLLLASLMQRAADRSLDRSLDRSNDIPPTGPR